MLSLIKMAELTSRNIQEKYGEPDWVGSYESKYARKTQWFYQLGSGKIRYVFFVDDIVIWDWIITEEKMLRVIYDDNQLV